jgi:alanyl-tRNA synthetase
LAAIEAHANAGVWAAAPVHTREEAYADAVASGAMALFGEKYGDVVRVVDIPDWSVELCGGTHVRNTAEIGCIRVVAESGVAAGVRRLEAVTGPRAFQFLTDRERALQQLATRLKVPLTAAPASLEQVERKLDALLDERRQLEKKLDEAMRGGAGGGGMAARLIEGARELGGVRVVIAQVEVPDTKGLQALGDAIREGIGSGAAVLAAAVDGKGALLAVVTDDLRDRGVRADALVREVAATVGGRGGGKPHMAQAGVEPAQLAQALEAVPTVVGRLVAGT